MFERFTDRARRVVLLAEEEAHALGHRHVGTEHVLLGLVHDGGGVAGAALSGLGLDLRRARREVEHLRGRGEAPTTGHLPFTPRAKRLLEQALREALQLGHNYLGTEHVLLGLLREGGTGAQVLGRLGVGVARAREAVLGLVPGRTASEAAGGPVAPALPGDAAAGDAPAANGVTDDPAWSTQVPPSPLTATAPAGVAEEARRRQHPRMGSEHVLLWLLSRPESGAMRALRAEGVEVAALRRRLEQMMAEVGDSTDP